MTGAADLAHRLARDAEAVCRHYLSNGRRHGRWWLVGDTNNTPGRSLFVRLHGPERGRGAAGKWTDAATGEHGDLLDLIGRVCGFDDLRDTLDEARRFLSLPRRPRETIRPLSPVGSSESARQLFRAGQSISGTLAEIYLRSRGITALGDLAALRFHPRLYYRAGDHAPRETWPAMLAAVTDADGTVTGIHRTWLARDGTCKAPIASPRRALGHLLGNAARFGAATDVLLIGEGIETALSLRTVMPAMPAAAALSAAHLAAFVPPAGLRRLYVARDNDEAGAGASAALAARAAALGIAAQVLTPPDGDFNDDLRQRRAEAIAADLRGQLAAEDIGRFLGTGRG
jgi:phage/plasmid primase-like uncharacterized protein